MQRMNPRTYSVLAMSFVFLSLGNLHAEGSEKNSLLGSPTNWVMGPVTGLPSLLGWRVERFWQEDTEVLPKWVAGADFGIALPGARLSVERRLREGPLYVGLGGRILYVPFFGFQEEARFYSLSIPIGYRFGSRLGNRGPHISVSVEVFTHDFREWRVLPALQISFLGKM